MKSMKLKHAACVCVCVCVCVCACVSFLFCKTWRFPAMHQPVFFLKILQWIHRVSSFQKDHMFSLLFFFFFSVIRSTMTATTMTPEQVWGCPEVDGDHTDYQNLSLTQLRVWSIEHCPGHGDMEVTSRPDRKCLPCLLTDLVTLCFQIWQVLPAQRHYCEVAVLRTVEKISRKPDFWMTCFI